MPGKLIAFILILVIIVSFIGFNIGNTSDVSLIFKTYEDVPIFVSFFFMYLIGVLSVIPFMFGWRRDRKKKDEETEIPEGDEKPPAKKRNKRVLGGRKKGDKNGGDEKLGPEVIIEESPAGEIPPEENGEKQD